MEQEEIRTKIVEKLQNRSLSKQRPRLLRSVESETMNEAEWWIGSGPAGDCSGCDEPIARGQNYQGFRAGGIATTRMHDVCVDIWEEERAPSQVAIWRS